MDTRTRKIVYSALFAALICCATLLRFPAGIGYVHAGDAVVILGAFLLPPLWGALAAAIGSAMADIICGYALYAPASFVIKALMALFCALILRHGKLKKPTLKAILAAASAELIMAAGYFCYDCFILRYGAAAVGDIPTNLVQAVFGAVAGVLLYRAIGKTKYRL